MRPTLEHLDKDSVMEVYSSLKSHYANMHARMVQEDKIFNQQFEGIIDVPYDVRITQSSTGTNIVEDYRNQIRTDRPTVIFRAVGRKDSAEKRALLMQRWGYGQLRKEREMGMSDPTLQCGMNLLLRGAACKKIIVDVDMLAGKPPRKSSAMYDQWEDKAMASWPFVSRAIDPPVVFPCR